MPTARRLEGRRVLVLRPEGQAEDLARALAEEGAVPVLVPAIRILPLPDTAALEAALRRDHDWVVFTSVNGVAAINEAVSGRVAAVGPATAEALDEGVDAVALTSASITEAFADAAGHPPDTRGAAIFSIGPATTAACHRAGLEVKAEAGTHTIPGLVATIADTMEV